MSSAVAPIPPPHRHLVSSSNGGTSGGGDPPPERRSKPTRVYPHIKDLIHKAETTVDSSRYSSIERLLDLADQALKQSLFYLELDRPDTAYIEYVVAYEICTTILPRAKDAPSLHGKVNLMEKQKRLRMSLSIEEDRYAKVRDSIKADNARYGTQPLIASKRKNSTASSQQSLPEPRPSSLQPVQPLKPTPAQDELFFQRNSYPTSPSRERSPSNASVSPIRNRQPNFYSVAGGSRPSNAQPYSAESTLGDRFAKLRLGQSAQATDASSSHLSNGMLHDQLATSSASSARKDEPSLHISSMSNTRQRMGPPINTSVHSTLPKQPSPAYTPTRGPQEGVRFQPPRSLRNSSQVIYERSPTVMSNASSARPISRSSTHKTFFDDDEEDDDLESQSSSSMKQHRRRRRSVNKPQETDLNAQKLFDYLMKFNVLLIDVRPRSIFDDGHIYHQSIMCVEPTALRQSMSAEHLQEALVLSPESEQTLFQRRNEFDLVVYHDQSSHIKDWGPHRQKSPNPALSHLNDALLDYNQEKPLQWPPILLNGGLDAWVDLLGPQALVTSDTSGKTRANKPLPRRPVPTDSPRLDIGKRRHREYNPLGQEEARKWRERARSASVMLDKRPPVNTNEPHENGDDGSVTMPDYEEFASRFPDVAAVEEQQSEGQTIPSSVPQYPTPAAPTAPPPAPPPQADQVASLPPPIPSRPPPSVPRRTYSGVGDRFQQSTAPVRPPKLAEYIPSRFRRLPYTGLHNFGVTCYMNATIQCMSATIPLTAEILECTNANIRDKFEKDNWKGTNGILGELYYVLLRNLWESTDADTIRPSNFRKYCARLNSEWGSDRQQDAKEFLEFLIDGLHEDLNRSWGRTPLRPLTDQEEANRERMPPLIAAKSEWGRATHRDHSKLTEIFAGQHMSRLQCTVCRHSSTTYEPFYSISVEIPKLKKPINIYDCLSSYCSAETLSGEEVWRCPHCKCEREAIKRITITRVPQTLVVHFKRFSASHSQSAKKITTPIDYPLESLDLGPYVLSQPDGAEAERIQQGYGAHSLEMPSSMNPPYRYNCYAVMRHIGGTIASGHYIALVKDEARQCWRKFDDSRVTNFQPDQLSRSDRMQNEQAYILFYKRVTSAEDTSRR